MSELNKILLNDTEYDLASGGISSVAQTLLINILRNGIYESDQSTNITNLETELAQGGSGSRVAIVNNLTNCANSNSAISVDIGASYVGTITADEGYEMDSITVTMGGVDVTSSVVVGDVITIASVSGTVSITAVAISTAESGLVHYWNLKTGSLIDTIDGETELTLDGSASIASGTGVTVSAKTDGITLPFAQTGDEIITKAKIKFGAINRTAFGNERLISVKNSSGSTPSVALRYSNTDSVWETSTDISTGITSPTAFADNELILLRSTSKISIQFNDETIVNEYSPGAAYNYIQIGGGSNGSGFYTFVIESIKTFVEVSE